MSAKAQQKQPSALDVQAQEAIETGALLPSAEQVMRLACLVVAHWLRQGIAHAVEYGEWREDYNDCVTTAELALEATERLGAGLPKVRDDFDTHWCRIAGAVRLAVSAFPNKESAAYRFLRAAEEHTANKLEVLEILGQEA